MEPISGGLAIAAQKAAQEVGNEVAKKVVQEIEKKGTTEVAKEVGTKIAKEVVHSSVDILAEESEVSVLKGATRPMVVVSDLGDNRLLNSTKLSKNLVNSGIEKILGFQAHHLIPSEILEKHSLGKILIEKFGTGYFDKSENGMFLPGKHADLNSQTNILPRHFTKHEVYSNHVSDNFTKLQNALEKKYGTLDLVPIEVLEKQIEKLQKNLKQSIVNDPSLRKGDRLC